MISKFFQYLEAADTEDDLQKLQTIIEHFDWYYKMADRMTIDQKDRLNQQTTLMKKLITKLRDDGRIDEVKKLWNEKAPKKLGPMDSDNTLESFMGWPTSVSEKKNTDDDEQRIVSGHLPPTKLVPGGQNYSH